MLQWGSRCSPGTALQAWVETVAVSFQGPRNKLKLVIGICGPLQLGDKLQVHNSCLFGKKKKVVNSQGQMRGLYFAHHSLFEMYTGFPGGSSGKESACQCSRHRFHPELGSSPGRGNGNPLPYSCLENPLDRGAWRAAGHRVTRSQTRLSYWAHRR